MLPSVEDWDINAWEYTETVEELCCQSSVSVAEERRVSSARTEMQMCEITGANEGAYRTGELACVQDMIHYQRFLHVSHRFVKLLQVSLIFYLCEKERKMQITYKGSRNHNRVFVCAQDGDRKQYLTETKRQRSSQMMNRFKHAVYDIYMQWSVSRHKTVSDTAV